MCITVVKGQWHSSDRSILKSRPCHIAIKYKLLCSEATLLLWPGSCRIVALDLGPAMWPLDKITLLLSIRYCVNSADKRLPESFALWGQFSCKIGHRYMSQPGVTQEWLQWSTATFMPKTDQEVCGGLRWRLSSPQALCSPAPQKWRLVLNLYTGEGLWRQTSISPVTLSADTSRNIGHVPPWRLRRGSGPTARKRFYKKE